MSVANTNGLLQGDDMQGDQRVSVTPQLAIGIFIMAAGILLTLDRLGVVDAGRTVRIWPAALIALGAAIWARRPDAHGRFWGSVWMLLGGWLLLNTLGFVRISLWDLFWPVVLMLVGLKLVMQTVRHGRPSGPAATDGTSLFAVMGESKRTNNDKPFRGGQMTAILGGCQLDLRQATIPPGEEALVEVFALMGGIEVWVPGSWAVTPDVVPVMGGVEDKRLMPVSDGVPVAPLDAPPRLLLRGHVVMGGLTIRN